MFKQAQAHKQRQHKVRVAGKAVKEVIVESKAEIARQRQTRRKQQMEAMGARNVSGLLTAAEQGRETEKRMLEAHRKGAIERGKAEVAQREREVQKEARIERLRKEALLPKYKPKPMRLGPPGPPPTQDVTHNPKMLAKLREHRMIRERKDRRERKQMMAGMPTPAQLHAASRRPGRVTQAQTLPAAKPRPTSADVLEGPLGHLKTAPRQAEVISAEDAYRQFGAEQLGAAVAQVHAIKAPKLPPGMGPPGITPGIGAPPVAPYEAGTLPPPPGLKGQRKTRALSVDPPFSERAPWAGSGATAAHVLNSGEAALQNRDVHRVVSPRTSQKRPAPAEFPPAPQQQLPTTPAMEKMLAFKAPAQLPGQSPLPADSGPPAPALPAGSGPPAVSTLKLPPPTRAQQLQAFRAPVSGVQLGPGPGVSGTSLGKPINKRPLNRAPLTAPTMGQLSGPQAAPQHQAPQQPGVPQRYPIAATAPVRAAPTADVRKQARKALLQPSMALQTAGTRRKTFPPLPLSPPPPNGRGNGARA